MAQIGTIRLGGIDVPYFHIADLDGNRLRVQEANGRVGGINLLPRATAAYPTLTIQHPQTGELLAPHNTVYQAIDDFERGNLDPYYAELYSPEFSVNSSAAFRGNLGLDAERGGAIYSMVGDGLHHYPQRGESFEFYFRVDTNRSSSYTNKFRLEFGVQNRNLNGLYRVDIETESEQGSSTLTFERRRNGTNQILYFGPIAPLPQEGRWERVQMTWVNNRFIGNWGTADGNILRDSWDVTDPNGGEIADGGIGVFTTNAVDMSFDHFRTIPRP